MAIPIRGIFVPHVTPVDEAGRINERELRRYLDWLIARGVDGLYPNGSTGEVTRLAAEERRLIVKIACESAAGRVPVLAGAAEANVSLTLQACEAYAEYGARAVAVVSPYYYKLSPSATFEYFHEIARHSPIDVVLYNIPAFATPLDAPTIRRLSELERIAGIKDSSGDVAFMLRLLRAVRPVRPDFAFLTGWEPTLMPLLVMGVDGGTHATAGVAPELIKAIYELTKSGHLDRARPLHMQLVELFDAMLAGGDFPAGFRAGVELRGFAVGPSPQPACVADEDARRAIARSLEASLDLIS